jgi:protein TonB
MNIISRQPSFRSEPPARRLAVAACVLLLHVLFVWGFIYQPRAPAPPPTVVHVFLLPRKVTPVPALPPPPLPHFLPHLPVVTEEAPPIAVAQPPASTLPPSPQGRAVAAPNVAAPPRSAPPPPPPDYLRRLEAYLNAYKDYPYEARERHQQGTVLLRFRMDRTGRVLSYQVVGSSGSAALDEEARQMIQRAQPLPPAPADYPGNIFDLTLPINFSLH